MKTNAQCAEYYLGTDPVKVSIGSAIVSRIYELGYGEEEWKEILHISLRYPDQLQLILLKSIRSGLSKEANLRKRKLERVEASLVQQKLFDVENY